MFSEQYRYVSEQLDDLLKYNHSCDYYGVFVEVFNEKIQRLLYNGDLSAKEHSSLFDRINPYLRTVNIDDSRKALRVLSNYRKKFKLHYEIYEEDPDYLRATAEFIGRMKEVFDKGLTDNYADYVSEISKLYLLLVKIIPTSTKRFTDVVIYNKLMNVLFSAKCLYTSEHLKDLIKSLEGIYTPMLEYYLGVFSYMHYRDILKYYVLNHGYVIPYHYGEPVDLTAIPIMIERVEDCFKIYGNPKGFKMTVDNKKVILECQRTLYDILLYGVTPSTYDRMNKLIYDDDVSDYVYKYCMSTINNYVTFLSSSHTTLLDGATKFNLYGNKFRLYMSLSNIKLTKEICDYYSHFFTKEFLEEFCYESSVDVYTAHGVNSDIYWDHVLALNLMHFFKAGLLPNALEIFNKYQKTGVKDSVYDLEDFDRESAKDILGMYRSTELGGLHKDSDTDVLYASKDFLDSILEETDNFK